MTTRYYATWHMSYTIVTIVALQNRNSAGHPALLRCSWTSYELRTCLQSALSRLPALLIMLVTQRRQYPRPSDQPDQPPVGIHHRQSLDAVRHHQTDRFGDRGVGRDGDNRAGHHIGGDAPARGDLQP